MSASDTVAFAINNLNVVGTLGLSGEFAGVAVDTLSAHCLATFDVSLDLMREVFKFQVDSIDMLDVGSSGVTFHFNGNYLGPVAGGVNSLSAAITNAATSGATDSNAKALNDNAYNAPGSTAVYLQHDMIRHMAYELFNTSHGVDLFTNELALSTDSATVGATALQAVRTTISGENLTNAVDNASGIGNKLLRQLKESNPLRFVVDGTQDTVSDTSGVQSIPFVAEDTLDFLYTLNPPSGQENIIPSAPPSMTARIYKIRLVMKA